MLLYEQMLSIVYREDTKYKYIMCNMKCTTAVTQRIDILQS